MGLGEAVERKRSNVKDDLILGFFRKPLGSHAAPQALFDPDHSFGRSFEAHGTAELFGFAATEARSGHRDPQELFLKDRDTERSLEDRAKRFMGIDDGFAAGSAIDVGMDHFADDRARSDDRNFDYEIIESPGFQPWECRHLCATLDLEDADRVGAAHHGICLGIVGRELCQVDLLTFMEMDQGDCFFEGGEHAEA